MQEKNPQEKAAAEKQAELLINAMERAKENGGVSQGEWRRMVEPIREDGTTFLSTRCQCLSLQCHDDGTSQ